ncbi:MULTISPECIES: hypothetical protein [unclassified Streptomyces]|uniref:hypothetical protein n=1 Tax=unclassified Streptomyces TaxID=2593676 RepID=UPI000939DDA1|nr:hypothetical protein [Streptomyces sp. CB02058]
MSTPIVIHHPSPTGGRRVTIRGQIVGLAYEDQDVIEFLRRAGLPPAGVGGVAGRARTRTRLRRARAGAAGGVGCLGHAG